MPNTFQEGLNQGIILGDGAMGTELYKRTEIAASRSVDKLSLAARALGLEVSVEMEAG